jgi:LacI family transcriptional regulator
MSTVKDKSGSRNSLTRKPRQKRVLVMSDWREEDLMNTITSEAMRLDWHLVDVMFLHDSPPTEFKPDGILYCRKDLPGFMPSMRKLGVPAVRIWHIPQLPPDNIIPTIGYDSMAIGRLVASHFLERGFRQVCRLSWHNNNPGNPDDLISRGLAETLGAAGARYLGETNLPVFEGQGWDIFNKAFKQWLDTMPRPLGVLTSGDVLGGHVVAACKKHHAAVPEEIAVIGLGNNRRWCRISPVPLTSVDWNNTLRAREAVRLLQAMMEGNPPPREPVLTPPAGVIARKSTDILAVEDVAVARAISFLWQHMSEPIAINDAAHAAGISRSTLERRFRKQIGRSVNDELLRKRLERCRELLLSTKLPMTDIAPQIGLLSKNYLHRAFRKHFGCSPKEFRLSQRGVKG